MGENLMILVAPSLPFRHRDSKLSANYQAILKGMANVGAYSQFRLRDGGDSYDGM